MQKGTREIAERCYQSATVSSQVKLGEKSFSILLTHSGSYGKVNQLFLLGSGAKWVVLTTYRIHAPPTSTAKLTIPHQYRAIKHKIGRLIMSSQI